MMITVFRQRISVCVVFGIIGSNLLRCAIQRFIVQLIGEAFHFGIPFAKHIAVHGRHFDRIDIICKLFTDGGCSLDKGVAVEGHIVFADKIDGHRLQFHNADILKGNGIGFGGFVSVLIFNRNIHTQIVQILQRSHTLRIIGIPVVNDLSHIQVEQCIAINQIVRRHTESHLSTSVATLTHHKGAADNLISLVRNFHTKADVHIRQVLFGRLGHAVQQIQRRINQIAILPIRVGFIAVRSHIHQFIPRGKLAFCNRFAQHQIGHGGFNHGHRFADVLQRSSITIVNQLCHLGLILLFHLCFRAVHIHIFAEVKHIVQLLDHRLTGVVDNLNIRYRYVCILQWCFRHAHLGDIVQHIANIVVIVVGSGAIDIHTLRHLGTAFAPLAVFFGRSQRNGHNRFRFITVGNLLQIHIPAIHMLSTSGVAQFNQIIVIKTGGFQRCFRCGQFQLQRIIVQITIQMHAIVIVGHAAHIHPVGPAVQRVSIRTAQRHSFAVIFKLRIRRFGSLQRGQQRHPITVIRCQRLFRVSQRVGKITTGRVQIVVGGIHRFLQQIARQVHNAHFGNGHLQCQSLFIAFALSNHVQLHRVGRIPVILIVFGHCRQRPRHVQGVAINRKVVFFGILPIGQMQIRPPRFAVAAGVLVFIRTQPEINLAQLAPRLFRRVRAQIGKGKVSLQHIIGIHSVRRRTGHIDTRATAGMVAGSAIRYAAPVKAEVVGGFGFDRRIPIKLGHQFFLTNHQRLLAKGDVDAFAAPFVFGKRAITAGNLFVAIVQQAVQVIIYQHFYPSKRGSCCERHRRLAVPHPCAIRLLHKRCRGQNLYSPGQLFAIRIFQRHTRRANVRQPIRFRNRGFAVLFVIVRQRRFQRIRQLLRQFG